MVTVLKHPKQIQEPVKPLATDSDGWVNASHKPFKKDFFELMRIITSTGRHLKGWWTGAKWDGLNLRTHETIVRWKRLEIDQELW